MYELDTCSDMDESHRGLNREYIQCDSILVKFTGRQNCCLRTHVQMVNYEEKQGYYYNEVRIIISYGFERVSQDQEGTHCGLLGYLLLTFCCCFFAWIW